MSSHDVNKVLDRAKEVLGFERDTDLADHLGLNRSTVANWRRRGSANTDAITNAVSAAGESTDYVLYGRRSEGGTVREAHIIDDQGRTLNKVSLWPGFRIEFR